MTRTRDLTISRLTYSELLATTPWIALLPNYAAAPPCEHRAHHRRGRGKACKSPGRLLYVDLDGSVHYFCHHHLYGARMSLEHLGYPGEESDEAKEAMRNYRWQRRVATESHP